MIAPALRRPFVGREAELQSLHARRRDASSGRGGVVLVGGDAGIGKTRLVSEFERGISNRRAVLCRATTREHGAPPFAPIAELIRTLDPLQKSTSAAASRDEFFERALESFERVSRHRTVVASIDDLHWAEPSAIELLMLLAREAASQRVLFVATYRSAPGDSSPSVRNTIVRLQRLERCSSIDLHPLSPAEVHLLLDSGPDREVDLAHDVVAEIVRSSEGNPLFAEELLKSAMDRGGPKSAALPHTIRAIVEERLRPLPKAERAILAQAAVIGTTFSLDVLAHTVDQPQEAVLGALQRARNLQLIVEDDGETFHFRHALTRECIYGSFLTKQRTIYHRRIAEFLERSSPPTRSLQDLAYHWWAARDAAKARTYGELSGDASVAAFAFEDAERYYRYALEFCERESHGEAALYLKLGLACQRQARHGAAKVAFERAAEGFRAAGDLRRECAARLETSSSLFSLGEGDPAAPLLEVYGRLMGAQDESLQSWMATELGQVHALAGRLDDASSALASVDIVRVEEPRVLFDYHNAKALVALRRCDVPDYLACLDAAERITAERDRPYARSILLVNAAEGLCEMGRLDASSEFFDRAEKLVHAPGFQGPRRAFFATKADLLILRGEFLGAVELLAKASATICDYPLTGPMIARPGIELGLLLDDAHLLDTYADESLLTTPYRAAVAASFAEYFAVTGRFGESRKLVGEILGVGYPLCSRFRDLLVVARFGGAAEIEAGREIALRFAARHGDAIFKASVPLYDAIAARRHGDRAKSVRCSVLAAARFRELGLPLYEAEALELSGDLENAAAIFRRIGALRPLRDIGGKVLASAPAAPGARETDGLTSREREIAELVVRGLSNPEIAERLNISTKTVEKNLTALYRKTGVSSRHKFIARSAGTMSPERYIESRV
jgi:DNA-binding CsgD family transcriptional regulator/tetratricopeptide (TPR) repeat protein